MDTLQAAILLEILEVFPDEVVRKEEIGKSYSAEFSKLDVLKHPKSTEVTRPFMHNTQYFQIREKRFRNNLKFKTYPQYHTTQSLCISNPYLMNLTIN